MDPEALDEAIAAARTDGRDDDHRERRPLDAVVFSDRHRNLLDGIDRADSVTFNPRTWCYVAKTCATLLLSDRTVLEEWFRAGAPYVDRGGTPNLGELSVQGTRHAAS